MYYLILTTTLHYIVVYDNIHKYSIIQGGGVMELSKEVLKGHIDTLIVSILNEKDCYGYEIAKTVKAKCNNMFELKEGTMYLALKRMESKGFIESYWSQEEGAGGRRKYYKMTDLGRETYQLKKQEWFFIKEVMKSFLGEEI